MAKARISLVSLCGAIAFLCAPRAIPFMGPLNSSSALVAHAVASSKVQPCFGKAEIRPTSYLISCADANSELASMHWKFWKETSARAKGIYEHNLCIPTCVAGRFVKDPATIKLVSPKKVGKSRVFSELVIWYHNQGKVVRITYSLPVKPLGAN